MKLCEFTIIKYRKPSTCFGQMDITQKHFFVTYPSENTSLKMATKGGRNM